MYVHSCLFSSVLVTRASECVCWACVVFVWLCPVMSRCGVISSCDVVILVGLQMLLFMCLSFSQMARAEVVQ